MFIENTSKCSDGGEHNFSIDAGWYESKKCCSKCGQPNHFFDPTISRDECCSKGGKHEFEMRQGGLGQTYEACAKCGCSPPTNGHLGFS